MSLGMIKEVCLVEMDALEARRLAERVAADAIAEAHLAGRDGVDATLARAASEIAHLIRASDHKATEEAVKLASATANRLATLRARAERRLDATATLILQYIRE